MSWFSRRTLVVLALGALLLGCQGPARPVDVTVGSKAPEIAGKDLDGKPLRLSEFRGKVVMLSFWASWCGPCRGLFPHERAILERYQGKPFALVGVNGDEDLDAARRLQEKGDVLWRSFTDAKGDIARAYGVDAFPYVFLIDSHGTVQYITRGVSAKTAREIDEKLTALVKDAEVGR
jgi:thiol-disulfide isomerase/thioredoxin